MRLTDKERKFLEKRARLIRSWPVAGGLMLCLLAGLGVWLVVFNPLLANPPVVFSRLRADSIPPGELTLLAAMLPVVVLTCLILALVMVLYGFIALRNEKRHLTLIRRLTGPEDSEKPGWPGRKIK